MTNLEWNQVGWRRQPKLPHQVSNGCTVLQYPDATEGFSAPAHLEQTCTLRNWRCQTELPSVSGLFSARVQCLCCQWDRSFYRGLQPKMIKLRVQLRRCLIIPKLSISDAQWSIIISLQFILGREGIHTFTGQLFQVFGCQLKQLIDYPLISLKWHCKTQMESGCKWNAKPKKRGYRPTPHILILSKITVRFKPTINCSGLAFGFQGSQTKLRESGSS